MGNGLQPDYTTVVRILSIPKLMIILQELLVQCIQHWRFIMFNYYFQIRLLANMQIVTIHSLSKGINSNEIITFNFSFYGRKKNENSQTDIEIGGRNAQICKRQLVPSLSIAIKRLQSFPSNRFKSSLMYLFDVLLALLNDWINWF